MIPTSSRISNVAVEKVSLSINEQVLAETRARVGSRGLSSYVSEALARQLQHDRLGDLLVEIEAEVGPPDPNLLEEARKLWRLED